MRSPNSTSDDIIRRLAIEERCHANQLDVVDHRSNDPGIVTMPITGEQ